MYSDVRSEIKLNMEFWIRVLLVHSILKSAHGFGLNPLILMPFMIRREEKIGDSTCLRITHTYDPLFCLFVCVYPHLFWISSGGMTSRRLLLHHAAPVCDTFGHSDPVEVFCCLAGFVPFEFRAFPMGV